MPAEDRMSAAIERVTRMAVRHAERTGFALQPDPAQLRYILDGLARNLLAHGRPYCPCREVTDGAEKNRLNICPCRTHRKEVAESGQCECGLFARGSENPRISKEGKDGVHH